MKKLIYRGILAAVAAIVAASSFISCSSDDEYYENGNYTLANKRMTRSSIEGDGEKEFLQYSNCGLWGLAQLMGDADSYTFQSAVLSAAKTSINWNEEANLDSLRNGGSLESISFSEIIAISKCIEDENAKKSGLERLNIDGRLPNTVINNASDAKNKLKEIQSSSSSKIHGAMVALRICVDGKWIDHWTPVDNIDDDYIYVRDPLTVNQYIKNEQIGISDVSDRYKNKYPVSSIQGLFYRK